MSNIKEQTSDCVEVYSYSSLSSLLGAQCFLLLLLVFFYFISMFGNWIVLNQFYFIFFSTACRDLMLSCSKHDLQWDPLRVKVPLLSCLKICINKVVSLSRVSFICCCCIKLWIGHEACPDCCFCSVKAHYSSLGPTWMLLQQMGGVWCTADLQLIYARVCALIGALINPCSRSRAFPNMWMW